MKASLVSVGVACLLGLGPVSVLAQPPAGAPVTVQVSEFKVVGNTLLPEATLQATLAPHKGQRTLEELKAAALAVQELYRAAGYGAVIAYLPEQSGPAGTATIAVLEGKIERIVVSGNKQYTEGNILRSLPALKVGVTPQVQKIDAQIQMANENPSKQVSVSLEPGEKQGEVAVSIAVQELPVNRWNVNVDNTGNESTGRWRTSLGYSNAALWDLDHSISLQFQTSPEHPDRVKVFSGSYRVPVYSLGAAVDVYAAHSNVDGGTSPTAAGPLQFSGKGKILGGRVTHYLLRQGEIDQRLILGADRRIYENDCSIGGLGPGACGTAGESVAVHPLTLEYAAQRGGERPFGLNVALSRNMALGGRYGGAANFQAVRPGATLRYTSVRLGMFGGLGLTTDWSLQGRANAQFSGDALVPGEQFGLGGAVSVRGYEEREILGDTGFSASLELQGPDLAPRFGNPAVKQARFGFFIDGGHAANHLDTPCREGTSSCWLGSWGVGFQLGAGGLTLRLDLAQALRDAARTRRGDARVHFQAVYSFI